MSARPTSHDITAALCEGISDQVYTMLANVHDQFTLEAQRARYLSERRIHHDPFKALWVAAGVGAAVASLIVGRGRAR